MAGIVTRHHVAPQNAEFQIAGKYALKRSLDVALAVIAAIILLPVMMLVALAIKLDSQGPVFFTQLRNGYNNRPFRIVKFRTLHTIEDGPIIQQVTQHDKRVTRVGRLLRRTSIDELPQLWNVIRGDMSLVGPRPHAAAHNRHYGSLIAGYSLRHGMLPGLTGWAQVNGFRGETATVELMRKRVEFDIWYVQNWSPWLDVKILARTLTLVMQAGAY